MMVQFGATLEKQRNQDWKEFYIDYHVRWRFQWARPVLIVCDVYVSTQADEPARAPVFGCVPESEKDTYVVSAATLSVELRASEPQSVEWCRRVGQYTSVVAASRKRQKRPERKRKREPFGGTSRPTNHADSGRFCNFDFSVSIPRRRQPVLFPHFNTEAIVGGNSLWCIPLVVVFRAIKINLETRGDERTGTVTFV